MPAKRVSQEVTVVVLHDDVTDIRPAVTTHKLIITISTPVVYQWHFLLAEDHM